MKPFQMMLRLQESRAAQVGLRTAGLVAIGMVAASPTVVAAQSGAADIGGLRAYWHVFIAYAIAIVLVLGWVVSIGRRLREVEERVGD